MNWTLLDLLLVFIASQTLFPAVAVCIDPQGQDPRRSARGAIALLAGHGLFLTSLLTYARFRGLRLGAVMLSAPSVKWLLITLIAGLIAVPIGQLFDCAILRQQGYVVPKQLFRWNAGGTPASIAVLWISSVAIGAINEEVLFRGIFASALAARWGIVVGIMGSSLLFGLAHAVNLRIVAQTIFFGSILAVVFFGSGSIVTPIVLHFVRNLVYELVAN